MIYTQPQCRFAAYLRVSPANIDSSPLMNQHYGKSQWRKFQGRSDSRHTRWPPYPHKLASLLEFCVQTCINVEPKYSVWTTFFVPTQPIAWNFLARKDWVLWCRVDCHWDDWLVEGVWSKLRENDSGTLTIRRTKQRTSNHSMSWSLGCKMHTIRSKRYWKNGGMLSGNDLQSGRAYAVQMTPANLNSVLVPGDSYYTLQRVWS